jgi:hypothetical protein
MEEVGARTKGAEPVGWPSRRCCCCCWPKWRPPARPAGSARSRRPRHRPALDSRPDYSTTVETRALLADRTRPSANKSESFVAATRPVMTAPPATAAASSSSSSPPPPAAAAASSSARPTPESNPRFFGWLSSLSRATGLGLTAASTLEGGSGGGRSIKQLEQDERDWTQCEAWKAHLMEWGESAQAHRDPVPEPEG